MAKRQHSEQDLAVPSGPKGLRQRGKGPTFYLKRQYRGQRYTISLGPSLDQARMRAQQIINAMDRGDFRLAEFQSEKSGIVESLTNAVDRLGTIADHSKKSRASYTNRVNQFTSFLNDCHPSAKFLSHLSPAMGQQFVEWRRRQLVTRSGKARPETPRHPPSAQTIHDDVRRLRALFKLLVRDDKLDVNVFDDVKVSVKARDRTATPTHLDAKQTHRLLAAAASYDLAPHGPGARSTFRGKMRDIVALYLFTGLRKEELLFLPWSHVDLDWGQYGRLAIHAVDEPVTLRIAPTAKQTARLVSIASARQCSERVFDSLSQMRACVPKNYADQEEEALMALRAPAWDDDDNRLLVKTRITWKQKATPGPIPLLPASRAILLRHNALRDGTSPFVFPHPDRGPLRSDPLPEFKKLLREAGIPASTRLHDLRHTFGFTLRDRGVPLETIMGLMRHANIEETMVYAKYTLSEGARHIQCLNDVF